MFCTHQRAELMKQTVSSIRKYASKERQPVRPGWPAGIHGGKGPGARPTGRKHSAQCLTSSNCQCWPGLETESLEPQIQGESALASRLLSSRLSRSSEERFRLVGRWELTSCWIRPWWRKQQPQRERNKAPPTWVSPISLLSKDLTPQSEGRALWHEGQVEILAVWAQKEPFSTRAKTDSRGLLPWGGGLRERPKSSRGGCSWPDSKAEQENLSIPHPAMSGEQNRLLLKRGQDVERLSLMRKYTEKSKSKGETEPWREKHLCDSIPLGIWSQWCPENHCNTKTRIQLTPD